MRDTGGVVGGLRGGQEKEKKTLRQKLNCKFLGFFFGGGECVVKEIVSTFL